ncbi:hypothetical protein RRL34_004261 [Vibrio parahaemolyticus]|nr:hypothetical protein [Vibrio parahaemolyticus]
MKITVTSTHFTTDLTLQQLFTIAQKIKDKLWFENGCAFKADFVYDDKIMITFSSDSELAKHGKSRYAISNASSDLDVDLTIVSIE